AVISNKADDYGLERAKQAGIATKVLSNKDFDSREAYDAQLMNVIDSFMPNLVVLAGVMRILTPSLVQKYVGTMLNNHPSL
ncbi:formyltransferase family protein, partial [Pseudoalteromonas agarivorans]|uniref:phosphoribosylglycinamide formyltransferase n=1 Tax=Pseudoalteromonas agarivorans TaxID=176102 RepID=UPI00311E3DE3